MLRHRLHFGPYATPRFRIGQHVEDLRRGTVRIVGLSDGPIQWPIGQTQRAKSLVLYQGLARAVQREAAAAVMHWWGVKASAVNKWRQALGVPRWNEGDLRLKAENGKVNLAAIEGMHLKARDPGRRAKIAAAKRGKPRPPEVIEALRRANLGKKLSAATRAKMSAAHKARGTWPPRQRSELPRREIGQWRTREFQNFAAAAVLRQAFSNASIKASRCDLEPSASGTSRSEPVCGDVMMKS